MKKKMMHDFEQWYLMSFKFSVSKEYRFKILKLDFFESD